MLRQDPAHMKDLVEKVQIWLLHESWKKAQYGVVACIKCTFFLQLSCLMLKVASVVNALYQEVLVKNIILWRTGKITKIQSALRGYLIREVQRPRLLSFQKREH